MVRSSAFLSVVIVAACGVLLLGELAFLASHRAAILRVYLKPIGMFIGLVGLNLFGSILALSRRLFLRDTGRKLAHVEKQIRTGSSISEELTEQIAE